MQQQLTMEYGHEAATVESHPRGTIAPIVVACGSPSVTQAMIRAVLGLRGSHNIDVQSDDADSLSDLPAGCWVILNGDDPAVRRRAAQCVAKVAWVGRGIDCDVAATQVRSSGGRLRFQVSGQEFDVPVWGRHHLIAALTATAVGWLRGLSWEEIAAGLAKFRCPSGHTEVFPAAGATIIDDTCNDNLSAMRAGLELLRDLPWSGRRIFVCGNVGDAPAAPPSFCTRLGEESVILSGADLLVACGSHAHEIRSGALHAGMPSEHVAACRTSDDVVAHLRRTLRAGDAVLVQGLQSPGMKTIVDQLRQVARRQAA